ncbi:MAG: 2OG-Fe(II) oxygenase [Bacteroidota bacterium]
MKKTEHKEDTIFTVEDFLTAEECNQHILWSEKRGYEQAKINSFGRQVVRSDVRNNLRVLFKDVALAESLWESVQPFCLQKFGSSIAIGLNEMFRFYKYGRGQQFKQHMDGSYERNESEFSLYTLMIYLNEDFLGGDTSFEDLIIKPKTGMALIFKHDLLHAGREVIKGEKYVLRTDIMYRFQR